ncbi:MAG: hypothetical protein KKE59_04800, partial [Proteobacteria bacterium]|nr:hypothetical protein [Pseudomonadota bacterium]
FFLRPLRISASLAFLQHRKPSTQPPLLKLTDTGTRYYMLTAAPFALVIFQGFEPYLVHRMVHMQTLKLDGLVSLSVMLAKSLKRFASYFWLN